MSRSYHYDCDFFQGEGVFILKKEDENEQVKVKTFFSGIEESRKRKLSGECCLPWTKPPKHILFQLIRS